MCKDLTLAVWRERAADGSDQSLTIANRTGAFMALP
jgi:hypothetical protein